MIFKKGDRVMIERSCRPLVTNYLYKTLGNRPLIGTVKAIRSGDVVSVDFSQKDLPKTGGGNLYGEEAKCSWTIRRDFDLYPGQFKAFMLTKVED